MTILLEAGRPDSLKQAVEALRRRETIVLPTDTVYGVGALAYDAAAVTGLFRVKERPSEKAIPVFVGSVADLPRVCGEIKPVLLPVLEYYWPGGLTAVLPASSSLPMVLTNNQPTVAVRMPNHPVVIELLVLVGEPLAVTSANLSGQPTPRTAAEIKDQLEGRVALILDDGPSPLAEPSTILDLTQFPPKILRQGAVQVAPEHLELEG
jgi:tRNA threonylcarbamoyl adenosine modification protein (Sua5/YciO/YrdC/YwlC family)